MCFSSQLRPPPTSQTTRNATPLVKSLLPEGINTKDKQQRLPTKEEMQSYPPPYIGVDSGKFGDGAVTDLGDVFHKDSIPEDLRAKTFAEARTIIVRALQNTRIANAPGPQAGMYKNRYDESWLTFINVQSRSVSASYFIPDSDSAQQFYAGPGNWSERMREFLMATASRTPKNQPNKGGAANGSQPGRAETNRTSSTAGSRR